MPLEQLSSFLFSHSLGDSTLAYAIITESKKIVTLEQQGDRVFLVQFDVGCQEARYCKRYLTDDISAYIMPSSEDQPSDFKPTLIANQAATHFVISNTLSELLIIKVSSANVMILDGPLPECSIQVFATSTARQYLNGGAIVEYYDQLYGVLLFASGYLRINLHSQEIIERSFEHEPANLIFFDKKYKFVGYRSGAYIYRTNIFLSRVRRCFFRQQVQAIRYADEVEKAVILDVDNNIWCYDFSSNTAYFLSQLDSLRPVSLLQYLGSSQVLGYVSAVFPEEIKFVSFAQPGRGEMTVAVNEKVSNFFCFYLSSQEIRIAVFTEAGKIEIYHLKLGV